MHIAIYTHVVPYPLQEGGAVAQFYFIERLSEEHMVSMIFPDQPDSRIIAFQRRLPKIRTYVVNKTEPKYFDQGRSFAKSIKKICCRFLPHKQEQTSFATFADYLRPPSAEFFNRVYQLIQNLKPDILQVDFIENTSLAALFQNIPTVAIIHELRSVSIDRIFKTKNIPKVYRECFTAMLQKNEQFLLKKVSKIIVFSDDDKRQLQECMPHDIHVIPFFIKKSFEVNTHNYSNTVEKLVFIGPDHHFPNLDAIEFFKNQIGRDVFKKLNLKLSVIGKWTKKNIAHLNCEFIEFPGVVNDLSPFYRKAISVIPLRIASGIRTKILDAFYAGVPVICSSVASEGLAVTHGKQILIANDPGEYIDSITQLIKNPELMKALADAGHEYLKINHDPEALYQQRLNVYSSVKRNIV